MSPLVRSASQDDIFPSSPEGRFDTAVSQWWAMFDSFHWLPFQLMLNINKCDALIRASYNWNIMRRQPQEMWLMWQCLRHRRSSFILNSLYGTFKEGRTRFGCFFRSYEIEALWHPLYMTLRHLLMLMFQWNVHLRVANVSKLQTDTVSHPADVSRNITY